jgi:xanthine phosphoribosyltransferase
VCVTSCEPAGAGTPTQEQGEVRVLKPSVAGDGGAGWLRVDDLADTSRTAQVVRRMLPRAHFATLHAEPAGGVVDACVQVFEQTKSIHFPWDIDYPFATPIKDGGRVASGPTPESA